MFIGKNWKIESDNLNIILSRRKVRKTKDGGKPYEAWEVCGYFSRVKNALEALADFQLRKTELKDLKTVVEKQDGIYKLIEKL